MERRSNDLKFYADPETIELIPKELGYTFVELPELCDIMIIGGIGNLSPQIESGDFSNPDYTSYDNNIKDLTLFNTACKYNKKVIAIGRAALLEYVMNGNTIVSVKRRRSYKEVRFKNGDSEPYPEYMNQALRSPSVSSVMILATSDANGEYIHGDEHVFQSGDIDIYCTSNTIGILMKPSYKTLTILDELVVSMVKGNYKQAVGNLLKKVNTVPENNGERVQPWEVFSQSSILDRLANMVTSMSESRTYVTQSVWDSISIEPFSSEETEEEEETL